MGATSASCGGWWMRAPGWRSSSTPPVLKVLVGPLPAQRCTGAGWMRERLITDVPPACKEYRTPEMYYKTILKGARKIADECPEM